MSLVKNVLESSILPNNDTFFIKFAGVRLGESIDYRIKSESTRLEIDSASTQQPHGMRTITILIFKSSGSESSVTFSSSSKAVAYTDVF